MIRMAFVLLLALAGACDSEEPIVAMNDDRPENAERPLFSIKVDGDGRGTVEVTSRGALSPAEESALQRLEAEPRVRDFLDRAERVATRGMPIIGLAQSLPEGALAIVRRDPAAEHSRLLVFDDASLSDGVYLGALSALRFDETMFPEIAAVRTLTIWRDGRMSMASEGRTSWVDFDIGPDRDRTRIARLFSESVTPAGAVEARDVGRVQLYRKR